MGMKANDKNVIPLCYKHHAMLHDQLGTEANLFSLYALHQATGMIAAKQLWIKSPHNPNNTDYSDDLPF